MGNQYMPRPRVPVFDYCGGNTQLLLSGGLDKQQINQDIRFKEAVPKNEGQREM